MTTVDIVLVSILVVTVYIGSFMCGYFYRVKKLRANGSMIVDMKNPEEDSIKIEFYADTIGELINKDILVLKVTKKT